MLLKVGPHIAEFSSWGFTNIYFLDNMTDNNPQPNLHKEVPSSLHIMNHVYRYYKFSNARPSHQKQTQRSSNYTPPGHYIKCFHNTHRVTALHNHFPKACIGTKKAAYYHYFITKPTKASLEKDPIKFYVCQPKQHNPGECKRGAIPNDLGHLQHYR